MSGRYVLLDRDGTLIEERNYLSDPAGVVLLPGVGAALRRLMDDGLGLVVVTNQSGIGRGYFTVDQMQAVNARLRELLAHPWGVRLAGVYHCPHRPEDDCDCRKPRAGLAISAARDLGFSAAESFVIGDNLGDLGLGRAIGARTVLVRTGYGREVEGEARARGWADAVADDMAAAAEWVSRALP